MSIEQLTTYAESDNIAELLDEDALVKIGSAVVEDYDNDKRSRADWEKKYDDAMKLAAQVVEEKSSPWPGASNVKYPLLTEAALQFNARAYPALVPNESIVKSRVVGFDQTGAKTEASIRVSKHMNFQLLEEMEEWEEHMDKLLMAVPIVGCMFKKTYYDPMKGRNMSTAVYPRDFVVDYYTTDLEEAYRKTHIMEMTASSIKQQVVTGTYLDVDLGDPVQKQPAVSDEIVGTSVPTVSEGTPYALLEQHTYLDLDDDGIGEPYIITVEKESNKVLRIVAGFDPEEIQVTDEGEVINIPQIQYFTKFGFVPSPDGGFYDMGFGQFLGPINNTVDTLINQLIDAGTLSNMQGGFIGRGARMKAGNLRFKPAEWKTINATGDDLRKNIFPMPVREPSNVLFQLLGMLINQAQRLSSTVDSMVGENPGQNQKATTTLAVIEQGSKVFSGIYKRLHRSFKKELIKLYKLNSQFLTEQAYFTVLDPNVPQEQLAQVLRNDYNPQSVNIVPAADTSVSSQQQKMAKAQAALELVGTGHVNPQEAVRRMLEAQEQTAIDVLMKVPQRGPSIEEQQLELDKLKFQLDVVKAQQDDVKIQAKAILDLANAEAAEEGSQLKSYELQLKTLVEKSKQMPTGGNNGTTNTGSNAPMGQPQRN